MKLRDEIAKMAYYLFEKSGRIQGRHEEHWYEAERVVMSRVDKKSKATAMAAKGAVASKPQKRGIWPQDKPAAEGKNTTRARRQKAKSVSRP